MAVEILSVTVASILTKKQARFTLEQEVIYVIRNLFFGKTDLTSAS